MMNKRDLVFYVVILCIGFILASAVVVIEALKIYQLNSNLNVCESFIEAEFDASYWFNNGEGRSIDFPYNWTEAFEKVNPKQELIKTWQICNETNYPIFVGTGTIHHFACNPCEQEFDLDKYPIDDFGYDWSKHYEQFNIWSCFDDKCVVYNAGCGQVARIDFDNITGSKILTHKEWCEK